MKRYFQDEDLGAQIGAFVLLSWIVGSIFVWLAPGFDDFSGAYFLVGGLLAGLYLCGAILACYWILRNLVAGAWLLVRVVGRVIARARSLFHDDRPRS